MKISIALALFAVTTETAMSQNCFLCGEEVNISDLHKDKIFYDYYVGSITDLQGAYPTCEYMDTYVKSLSTVECANFPPSGSRVDIQSFCGCPGANAPNVCKVCGDGTELADPNQDASNNMYDWDLDVTCGWVSDYAASMVQEELGWCKENILVDWAESAAPGELPPSFPTDFVPVTEACCVPASVPGGDVPTSAPGGDSSGDHPVLLQNTGGLAFGLLLLVLLVS